VPLPLAASVTAVGFKVAVGGKRQAPEQATDAVKPTFPENPLRLVSVMVDVPEDPTTMLNELGFEFTPKSGGGGGGVSLHADSGWSSQ